MNREVMIVAGEASGDLHGAHLIKSLQRLNPELSFCGMGGSEIARTGAEILFEASKISVVGFFEVISHLKDIIAAQRTLRKRLTESKPALLILIDFPDFNLLLARKAKKLGIPIFYYISPQVWAWRSGRVKTIKRLVDKICVILPFEESYFRSRGVDATYVGHPLLDSVKTSQTKDQYCSSQNIPGNVKLIGILPGSRVKEVARLMPVFLEAAVKLQEKCSDKLWFIVPCATTLKNDDLLDNGINDYQDRLNLKIVSEDRYNMMAACDIVIAASGTVTLELLLLNTPMVVAYKVSPRTYRLGKLLVKVKYFSLVNLIGEKTIVPELLQDEANPDRISEELLKLMYDEKERQKIETGFQKVKQKLGSAGASERAAQLALRLMPH
jgi:lipid-A-disaccharide synthase